VWLTCGFACLRRGYATGEVPASPSGLHVLVPRVWSALPTQLEMLSKPYIDDL